MTNVPSDPTAWTLPQLDFHQVTVFAVKYAHRRGWEKIPMPGKGFGDPNDNQKYAVRNAIFGNTVGTDYGALAALAGRHPVCKKHGDVEYVYVRGQARPLVFAHVDGAPVVVPVDTFDPPKLDAMPELLEHARPCTEELWG